MLITSMQQSVITNFADMVESRDLNTGEHIHRTSAYVNIIAQSLRKNKAYTDILSDEYIEDLTRSAPLHDIGKIRISDVLLNKPGKLTSEEFEVMKTHTTAGKDILSRISSDGNTTYLGIAAELAAYHHERWDGQGYPERLSGTDIPLSARIMAVADVFDALTSKRSYKEAMDAQEALCVIASESGTHFDPAVVEAFLAAKEKIVRCCNHNQ